MNCDLLFLILNNAITHPLDVPLLKNMLIISNILVYSMTVTPHVHWLQATTQ